MLRPISGSEKRHLFFLVLFALSLRLYVFLTLPVIGTDGYNWFHTARCFVEGNFGAGFGHPIHPLYPILFAGLTRVIGDYEVAGKTVALVMGVLGIFPLYFLARGFFGHYAGLFAAFLLAVNPTHVRLSADIMSDTTNLFFFLSAVWLGWEAIRRDSWRLYVLAGVCVVLSYYTRAESLALSAVLFVWFVLSNNAEGVGKRAVRVGLFVGTIILLSAPYILFIHKEKGVWHVTQQEVGWVASGHIKRTPGPLVEEGGRMVEVLESQKEDRVSEAEKISRWKEKGHYHMIFLLTLNELVMDVYQPFLPFLLIGFFQVTLAEQSGPQFVRGPWRIMQGLLSLRVRRASSDAKGESFLLSFFGLYFCLYYLLAYNVYYISGRYVLPMAVLSLLWAGLGVEKTSQYLRQFAPSLGGDMFGFSRAGLYLLLALLAVSLPKDLKIKHRDDIPKKEAGRWIRANAPVERPVIAGFGRVDLEKVAFYAEGEFRHLYSTNYDTFQGFINEVMPDYLVLCREDLLEEVLSAIDRSNKFVLIKEWVSKRKGKESHFRFYRVD